jgi:gamma-glutamylcyclotransferase (GGCT)/AIG2-like uncharacterized protein YtfP
VSSEPHLFVYGTLKSSFVRNRFSRYLAANAQLVGTAKMRGRLYRLKRYPGMRLPLSGEDWVIGEIYRLRKPVATLATLDAYEDREYRRLRREAWLEDGTRVKCWVYVWGKALARARRVASGEWSAPA